ncbi:hypothetical protein JYU34_003125 [Plutella xylostella]|uniref:Uncharacterized protein n=1 Tax=Plutella xylostella TaxID=51655 RepID=A0ABQ7QZ85_PLUXY|nr:hypothetical protein JYU34_003125 [Plutella xylostella]
MPRQVPTVNVPLIPERVHSYTTLPRYNHIHTAERNLVQSHTHAAQRNLVQSHTHVTEIPGTVTHTRLRGRWLASWADMNETDRTYGP